MAKPASPRTRENELDGALAQAAYQKLRERQIAAYANKTPSRELDGWCRVVKGCCRILAQNNFRHLTEKQRAACEKALGPELAAKIRERFQ